MDKSWRDYIIKVKKMCRSYECAQEVAPECFTEEKKAEREQSEQDEIRKWFEDHKIPIKETMFTKHIKPVNSVPGWSYVDRTERKYE